MKYIPNLIPKEYRVDIEPPATSPPNLAHSKLKNTGNYIASGIFFIGFLGTIFTRFWEGLTALSIALLFFPKVHLWIERKLRFKFTFLIKSLTVAILIAALFAFSSRYNRLYHEEIARKHADSVRVATEEQQLRIEKQKQQQQLDDTLTYFKSQAAIKSKQGKYTSAVSLLSQGLAFAPHDENLIALRAETHYRSGAYQGALADYSQLIRLDYNTFESYYQRANCYLRLGNKATAISDLKKAIDKGNGKAKQLYDKINPLKRRIVGYVTRCCDGSTSGATGRGACSHHGGVCNWRDPIYQEYREFE